MSAAALVRAARRDCNDVDGAVRIVSSPPAHAESVVHGAIAAQPDGWAAVASTRRGDSGLGHRTCTPFLIDKFSRLLRRSDSTEKERTDTPRTASYHS